MATEIKTSAEVRHETEVLSRLADKLAARRAALYDFVRTPRGVEAMRDAALVSDLERQLDAIALEAASIRTMLEAVQHSRRGRTTYERVRRALGYTGHR